MLFTHSKNEKYENMNSTEFSISTNLPSDRIFVYKTLTYEVDRHVDFFFKKPYNY